MDIHPAVVSCCVILCTRLWSWCAMIYVLCVCILTSFVRAPEVCQEPNLPQPPLLFFRLLSFAIKGAELRPHTQSESPAAKHSPLLTLVWLSRNILQPSCCDIWDRSCRRHKLGEMCLWQCVKWKLINNMHWLTDEFRIGCAASGEEQLFSPFFNLM